MTHVNFPIFDLKTSKNIVFIAGGGGDKGYGKANGVVAIMKDAVGEEDDHIVDFYETPDFILKIQVYTDSEPERTESMEKTALEKMPVISSKFDIDSVEPKLDNSSETDNYVESKHSTETDNYVELKHSTETDNYIEAKLDSSNETESYIEPDQETKAEVDAQKEHIVESKKKSKRETFKTVIFITAIGDNFFYVLRFDGKFKLQTKLEKRIKQAYLNDFLVLLRGNTVFGFNNTTSPEFELKLKPRAISENLTEDMEEYVYKLYKHRKEAVILNELCTRDVPENWAGFFVESDRIHKIIQENDKSVFVFRNQKYEVEGQICNPFVSGSKLIFYSNTEKQGHLYFVSSKMDMYKVPRITAISHFGSFTCVSTSSGEVLLYNDSQFSRKYEISSVPITGLSIDSESIYFSLLTGDVKCLVYTKNNHYAVVIISVSILIFAMIIALLKQFKK